MTEWSTCRLPGHFLSPPPAWDDRRRPGQPPLSLCLSQTKWRTGLFLLYNRAYNAFAAVAPCRMEEGGSSVTSGSCSSPGSLCAAEGPGDALSLCILKGGRRLLGLGHRKVCDPGYGYNGCWGWIIPNRCTACTKHAAAFKLRFNFMYLEFDLLSGI